jgi:hypothetical protein
VAFGVPSRHGAPNGKRDDSQTSGQAKEKAQKKCFGAHADTTARAKAQLRHKRRKQGKGG